MESWSKKKKHLINVRLQYLPIAYIEVAQRNLSCGGVKLSIG